MSDSAVAGEPTAADAKVPLRTDNPYVGPRSLVTGERIYGRAHALFELQNLLIAERIVLLYGPSGAGKTSLIQAGLVPEMEREEFDVLPLIRVGKPPSGSVRNRYVASAIRSLEEHLPRETAPLAESEVNTLSFAAYLQMRKPVRRWDSCLLIFDQFEEVLTADPLDEEAKLEFFSEVGTALRDSSTWALFAIRERHLAALNPYTRALPSRLKSSMRLDLLHLDGASDAIEKPAAAHGVHFTGDAVKRLVDDLREVAVQARDGTSKTRLGHYIEPVHLQVVCFRLWEQTRVKPDEIGVSDIASTGNVEAALENYYADRVAAVAKATGVKEKTLRHWIDRHLISEAGVRVEVLKDAGGVEGITDTAVDALEAAHLIRTDQRSGATSLELAHDRLVTPIRADNAQWFERHLSLLQQQAALWERQGRKDAVLLRDNALHKARAWADANPAELTTVDRAFLEASEKDERSRSFSFYVQWAVGSSVAVIVAAGFALAAWLQREEARTQEGNAKNQATIASARGLASLAYRLFDERLDLATLLAYEAFKKQNLPETRATVLASLLVQPRLTTYLHGHQSAIGALAFSPDGKRLAVGDFNSRIVLWDVEKQRPAEALPKSFRDAVRSIAFTPDHRFLVASSKDGSILLRDLERAEEIRLPKENAHSGDIWSVAVSRDSALMASADTSGKIIVWDVATRTPTVLGPGAGESRTVAFNASGTLLAAGFQDGSVQVWQKQEGNWQLFDQFPASAATEAEKARRGSRITCVAFHPRDDNLLASGSRDWTVNLRDVRGRRDIARGTHWGSLNALAFSPGGELLVTAAQDSTLRLWRVPPPGEAAPTSAPETAPGEPSPASTPETAIVTPPRVRPLQMIGRPLTGHVGWVLALAFSPDGRTVASGGIDREVILWNTEHALEEEQTPGDGANADVALAVSPRAKFVVAGHRDGRVVCRERVTGEERVAATHPQYVRNISFSTGGRFMISSSGDKTAGVVMINDLEQPQTEPVRLEIPRHITFAAISPDGTRAAVAAYGGEILLWDVQKREQVGPPLTGLDDVITFAVAFSPDGKRITAGGNNQFAITWHLESGLRRPQVEQHNGSVRAAAFSPDGKILATASGDNTVLLSDPATGRSLGPPLTAHRAPVVALAFNPDGSMLASGSEDRSVVLWDVQTRQQVGPRLVKHVNPVRGLGFSEDGDHLFSISSAFDTAHWDLDPATFAARCRARANRNMTAPEWQAHMGGEPYRKTWEDLPAASDNVAVIAPTR